MSILELQKQLEEFNDFCEKTNIIVDKLCDWKLESLVTNKKPSREMILEQLKAFVAVLSKAKKAGVLDNNIYAYEYCTATKEAFKFFEDVMPELKRLK